MVNNNMGIQQGAQTSSQNMLAGLGQRQQLQGQHMNQMSQQMAQKQAQEQSRRTVQTVRKQGVHTIIYQVKH